MEWERRGRLRKLSGAEISGIWCHEGLGGGERQRMQDPFLAWTTGWVAVLFMVGCWGWVGSDA